MSDKHRLGAGAISLHDGTEGLVVASHGGGAGLGEGLEAGADHRSASASRPSPSPAPPPWLATTRPSVPSCSEIAPAPSRCLSLISPRSSGAGLSTIAPGPQRRASPKWTISPTNSCAAGRNGGTGTSRQRGSPTSTGGVTGVPGTSPHQPGQSSPATTRPQSSGIARSKAAAVHLMETGSTGVFAWGAALTSRGGPPSSSTANAVFAPDVDCTFVMETCSKSTTSVPQLATPPWLLPRAEVGRPSPGCHRCS